MDNDWVAFEAAETFKPEGIESAKINEDSHKRRRKKNKKDRRSGRDSSETKMTWMEKPINDDSSWLPIAPPPQREQVVEERDDVPVDPRRSNGTPVSRPPLISQRALSTGGSEGRDGATARRSSASYSTHERARARLSSRARAYSETREKPVAPPPSTQRSRGRTTTRKSDSTVRRSSSLTRAETMSREKTVAPPPSTQRSRGRTTTRKSDSTVRRSSSLTAAEAMHQRGRRRSRSTSRTRVESPSPRTHPRARSASRTRVESPSPQNRRGRFRSSSRTRVESPSPLSRTSWSQASNRIRMETMSPTPRLPPIRCSEPTTRGRTNDIRRSESRSRSLSRSQGGMPSLSPRHRTNCRSSSSVDNGTPSRLPLALAADESSSTGQMGQSTLSRKSTRKEGGIMERFFGDHVNHNILLSNVSLGSLGRDENMESIHPRVLLSATVYKNAATNLWIATINTNQRGVATNPKLASKYLKAFSFGSELEAREAAIANAPPKMMLFEESPNCFVCKGKFAVFRRARHCRNCGACVCANCATTWPNRMLPETYNLKNENMVNVCKSCSYLTDSFQKALLKGDLELALELYHTGNINLRCPLPTPVAGTKKAEIMYPIHCAVHGGNLNIVRWLVDEHFCPIKIVKKGNGKGRSSDTAVVTSKGRSALSIAMSGLQVDIIRYLVVDKGVPLYETKDLQLSLRALEAVLLAFPATHSTTEFDNREVVVPRWDDTSFSGDEGSYICSSLGEDQSNLGDLSFQEHAPVDNMDLCILCYDRTIDCVITPCGHQICCLACSRNLKACPVCNVDCNIIQIFKP